MKKILSLILAGVLSSCGTIVNGTHQDVLINSNVEGATVKVDGVPYGKTPLQTELKRTTGHVVQLSAEGYETAAVVVHNEMSWWFAGNILLGGLIGMGVDCISGGAWALDDEKLEYIELEKIELDKQKKTTRITLLPDMATFLSNGS